MHLPRILHIFNNDKIVKDTITLFNKVTEYKQSFIIISNDVEKIEGSYSDIENLELIEQNSELIEKLRRKIDGFDIVFLQALSYPKAKLLAKNKFKNTIFIWGLWGYELYNYVYYKKRVERNSISFIQKLKDYYTFNIIYKRAFKKINYALFLLEYDYNLLKDNAKTKAKWLPGSYQTIEQINEHFPNFKVAGNSILVGNSSTSSNNHFLIFDKISSIREKKIICPLNYGDLNYQREVIIAGNNIFNDDFFPLVEFLPLKDYLEIIKECGVTIFAHERQQAFGTIIQMLYAGSKVFLSNKSPLYGYCIDNGFYVYSVEDDLDINSAVPLEEALALKNREIATSVFSEKYVLERKVKMFKRLEQEFYEQSR
ncbi:MAG: TDP-N-acetylfucosamine:lipid II N-acetylfucosaminyltransferase [Bacteroidales bacterium]